MCSDFLLGCYAVVLKVILLSQNESPVKMPATKIDEMFGEGITPRTTA